MRESYYNMDYTAIPDFILEHWLYHYELWCQENNQIPEYTAVFELRNSPEAIDHILYHAELYADKHGFELDGTEFYERTEAGKKAIKESFETEEIIDDLATDLENARVQWLGTDASLNISLGEYICYFPKPKVVVLGNVDSDVFYYENYDIKDMQDALNDYADDGFWDFVGQIEPEDISRLDDYETLSLFQSLCMYTSIFTNVISAEELDDNIRNIFDLPPSVKEKKVKQGNSEKDKLNTKSKKENKNMKTLKEARYPTQESAEALVEWTNKMSEVYIGAAGNIVRNAFDKADQIRIAIWEEIFGDNSPWATRRGRKGVEVYWDSDKAEKLGLNEKEIKDMKKNKKTEAVDVKKVIKDLQGNFAKDNEAQMKGVQLLKGLATSEEPISNEFMKKLDKETTKISKEVLGEAEEEKGEKSKSTSKNSPVIVEITKDVRVNDEVILEKGDKIEIL